MNSPLTPMLLHLGDSVNSDETNRKIDREDVLRAKIIRFRIQYEALIGGGRSLTEP